MFARLTRILMTAVEASPGSGAPPAAAPSSPGSAPTQAPASGAAPAIDSATEEALIKRGRDAAYAELRRSGALKRSAIEAIEGPPKQTAATNGHAPAADLSTLRRLDRALTRGGRTIGNDRAYDRLEKAFVAEAPDDADAWLKEYFEGLGVPAVVSSATAAPTTNQPRTALPTSNAGAPHVEAPAVADLDFASMTRQDVERILKEKGLGWYNTKFREYMKGRKVSIR